MPEEIACNMDQLAVGILILCNAVMPDVEDKRIAIESRFRKDY